MQQFGIELVLLIDHNPRIHHRRRQAEQRLVLVVRGRYIDMVIFLWRHTLWQPQRELCLVFFEYQPYPPQE